MILAVIVGLCAGALLAQHFRALIIIPASLTAVAFAAGVALVGVQGASQIFAEMLCAAAALQVGYFFGLVIKPAATDPLKSQLNTALRR